MSDENDNSICWNCGCGHSRDLGTSDEIATLRQRVQDLEAQLAEAKKDSERLAFLMDITSHPPCDFDRYRRQIDAAIEAAGKERGE